MSDRIVVTGHRKVRGDVGEFARRVFATFARPGQEFLIGMAVGWDMSCAQACADLGITFHAVLPFKEQPNRWPVSAQRQYHELLAVARTVSIVSDRPSNAAYLERNLVMLGACDGNVWALWDGSRGGTQHCVSNALAQGKKVWNYWDSFMAASRPSPLG